MPKPKSTEEELAELKTATREAHEVLKDIRHANKTTEALLARIPKIVSEQIASFIEEEAAKQLKGLGDATEKFIKDCEFRINRRFDNLAAILMGEDPESQKQGKMSIPELVKLKSYVKKIEQLGLDVQLVKESEIRDQS